MTRDPLFFPSREIILTYLENNWSPGKELSNIERKVIAAVAEFFANERIRDGDMEQTLALMFDARKLLDSLPSHLAMPLQAVMTKQLIPMLIQCAKSNKDVAIWMAFERIKKIQFQNDFPEKDASTCCLPFWQFFGFAPQKI